MAGESALLTTVAVESLHVPDSTVKITGVLVEILTKRYTVGTPLVIPDGLAPDWITIPRRVAETVVPDVYGVVAPTGTFDVVQVHYSGIVYAETDDGLRAILDPFFATLYGSLNPSTEPIWVEVWPDRFLACRLAQRNPNPRWPAVSGNAVELEFTLTSMDAYWRDTSGYELWKIP